jgi:hypothetical protein
MPADLQGVTLRLPLCEISEISYISEISDICVTHPDHSPFYFL